MAVGAVREARRLSSGLWRGARARRGAVQGAIRFAGFWTSPGRGACGPPPPFVAPLVPRCALAPGATPRDVLSRPAPAAAPSSLALTSMAVATWPWT